MLAIALLRVVGCVKAPERTEADLGVAPPEAWTRTEGRAGVSEAEWWMQFGDPQLDALIELALAENYDLAAAAARLDQAEAQARIAGADLKPTVGLSVSGSRQKINFFGLPFAASNTYSQFDAGVSVGWEADLWGRIRAGARAAVADAQAVQADLAAARLSIAGHTAKLWFRVAEAQEQFDLARHSADSFRDLAERIRVRYEHGIRPALELRLAISNQATAEALLEQRRIELDQGLRLLEVVLGRYPSASLLAQFPLGPPATTPPPVPVGLPSELVSRRPDLVAAERRLAASDQRYLVAKRSLYPRLGLTANGGTASQALGDLLSGSSLVWKLLAGITQPLFQGGRLRAGVDLADAAGDAALARYASAVLMAYSEVESALASETYLRDWEESLTEAATQLVAAERLAERRYTNGVGDYLTVLDSQTRSVIAQSNLLSLRRARLDNRVDLHLALGGGFDPSTLDPNRVVLTDTDSDEEDEL